MKVHHLKTHPEPFEQMRVGRKLHEFRKDDGRSFAVGDVLVLREWDPAIFIGGDSPGEYTGRDLKRRVTYLSRGPDWGIPEGYVVMSVVPHLDEDVTEPAIPPPSHPEKNGSWNCSCFHAPEQHGPEGCLMMSLLRGHCPCTAKRPR